MMHNQVQYKDFTVDIEMLPLIENLNNSGIQTLYSCCGLDEDGNKDTPARELIKKIPDTISTIAANIVILKISVCHSPSVSSTGTVILRYMPLLSGSQTASLSTPL